VSLRFSELCIDAADVHALGQWWSVALGWPSEVTEDGDGLLRAPSGPDWLFLPVPDDSRARLVEPAECLLVRLGLLRCERIGREVGAHRVHVAERVLQKGLGSGPWLLRPRDIAAGGRSSNAAP